MPWLRLKLLQSLSYRDFPAWLRFRWAGGATEWYDYRENPGMNPALRKRIGGMTWGHVDAYRAKIARFLA